MNPTDLFLMRAASILNHSLSYAPFNWSAPPENKGINLDNKRPCSSF